MPRSTTILPQRELLRRRIPAPEELLRLGRCLPLEPLSYVAVCKSMKKIWQSNLKKAFSFSTFLTILASTAIVSLMSLTNEDRITLEEIGSLCRIR